MTETEAKQTPDERAADRAHYVREERIGQAMVLTQQAMKDGGLPPQDVTSFLRDVHATLASLGAPAVVEPEAPALLPLTPAVPVKKSVTDGHIVSLIDGSKLQTLTRHITKHGFTPDSYRAAYGLPADYPMVAAAYTRKRAEIAKAQGLGSRVKPTPAAAAA